MELRVDVVGAGPALVDRRVGADDVVVGEQMVIPQLLHALPVGADGTHVGADLGLREDDADPHHEQGAPVLNAGAGRR